VQYGSSYEGRPLLAIEITANVQTNDTSKSDFLFSAGIHAREIISSEASLKIAEDLVNGYNSTDAATKAKYQNMLTQRDVWIIPNQNPDGRLQVEGGLYSQRKNWHLYTGQSEANRTRGVDLNRNYPHQWSKTTGGVTVETYKGPSALSEPESNTLWDFLHNETYFSNLLCSLDFHSGDQRIMTPWTWYQDPSPALPVADAARFNVLKTELGALTQLQTGPYTIGAVYGSFADSLYEEFGSFSMTEELYRGGNTISTQEDYYRYFNPTDVATRDAAIKKAVDSALYLLSDAAFAVPEPSTFILLAVAGLMFVGRLKKSRKNLSA
jgi:hypothetical protein